MKNFSLLGAAFLLFLSFDVAFGCVCFLAENPTPESVRAARQKEFGKATVVFSGEVIKSDKFKAEFKVDKIWKGDSINRVLMLTGIKENGDGTQTSSSCDFSFKLGEKYLIYAYGELDELKTHECSRSSLLKNAVEEIEGLEKITPHKVINESP
jgi:hypothetical protein